MNLNIKATKTTLTSSLQEEIEKKLSVLEDFLRPEDKVQVEIEARASKDNSQEFRAEIIIRPSGLFADASGGDVYEALDLAVPKVRQQLIKSKDKKVSERRSFGGLKWKFWKRD
jgi:ribosomal subunit interface protein